MTPRVGLIGARRHRQGLGPFVARDLKAAGATVPCLLGTRSETVELAEHQLFEQAGIRVRGYTRLEEMLGREDLDALAILSPAETHESYLCTAADAGLHVLCEKPLVWAGRALLDRARRRAEAFRVRGLLLSENCQWPYALEAFRVLHPGTLDGPPRTFSMRLSPASRGVQLLGDCLPHPLSILQALAPGRRPIIENARYALLTGDMANLGVAFDYRAGGVRVHTEVELRSGARGPRPASLEIDGRRAERRVRLPSYEIAFSEGDRSVPVADPLTARVRAFVADLEAVMAGAPPPDPTPIVDRMAMLESLVEAYRVQVDDPDL